MTSDRSGGPGGLGEAGGWAPSVSILWWGRPARWWGGRLSSILFLEWRRPTVLFIFSIVISCSVLANACLSSLCSVLTCISTTYSTSITGVVAVMMVVHLKFPYLFSFPTCLIACDHHTVVTEDAVPGEALCLLSGSTVPCFGDGGHITDDSVSIYMQW
jgi:hypothetical protein